MEWSDEWERIEEEWEPKSTREKDRANWRVV